MLTRNENFGNLTGLVEEHRKTENFFQALKFKENFFKINNLIFNLLEFGEVEVLRCFDYQSEDLYESTFRKLVLRNKDGLKEYLEGNCSELIESINLEEDTLEIKFK